MNLPSSERENNPASDISKLLSWLQMPERSSQIRGREKSSKCTREGTWQGCQPGLIFSGKFWAKTSTRDGWTSRRFLLLQIRHRQAGTTDCVVWFFCHGWRNLCQERFHLPVYLSSSLNDQAISMWTWVPEKNLYSLVVKPKHCSQHALWVLRELRSLTLWLRHPKHSRKKVTRDHCTPTSKAIVTTNKQDNKRCKGWRERNPVHCRWEWKTGNSCGKQCSGSSKN